MKILGVALCSCCRTNPPVNNQRYCAKCRNWIARKTRKKYRDLDSTEKMKADARTRASQEVRRGNITRRPCEVCGERVAEKHHDNYQSPLEVRWLCRKHHLEFHRNAIVPRISFAK